MGKFEKKIIWITGASSGFGEAMAKAFAGEGASIILSGRNVEALNKAKAEIPNSKIVVLDAEHPDSFQEKTQEAISAFGHIDIIIHNAGIAQNSKAIDTQWEVEKKIMQVDYFAPVQLTKCILPHFMERKQGTIVVVSGLLGYINLPGRSTYAAAKSALTSYFGCLRAEIKDYNIAVSVLVPGSLHTNLVNKALVADGSVIASQKKGIGGCPLDVAAKQVVRAIEKKKTQSYIGERKEFYMWKLWGLFPNFINRKIAGL